MLMYSWSALKWVVLTVLPALVSAGGDLAFKDDTDLTNFVTRPELRVPKLKVTYKAEEGVSEGLWFLGPYGKIEQQRHAPRYYQACQTGPTLYDNDGELVWSGACIVENSNTCDFRAFTDENGTNYLSMIFHGHGGISNDIKHMATIMDNTYNLSTARNTTSTIFESGFNMHEFKVIDGGRSALYLTYSPRLTDVRDLPINSLEVGWVSDIGFREIDVASGNITHEWWCLEKGRISPNETTVGVDENALWGPWPKGWNWFHPNSVDKSSEGDYMISGRFVDTIYKISGKDGSILWRLGGKMSDFHMLDFNFSKQHDAQFVGTDPQTGIEVISFFDNAKAINAGGINTEPTSNVSSGLVVGLDTKTWTAKLLHRVDRPDKGITALRGNFQRLPNHNSVGGWSENGYLSEHGPDGRLLFEASFASTRFVNYRTYKFNFTGNPTEPPILKAFVYGETRESSTTAWYVSWNGATEVDMWKFWRGDPASEAPAEVVGTSKKKGFETVFQSDGVEDSVFVEAVAKNGSVIGRSEPGHAVRTWDWNTVIEDVPIDGHAESSETRAWDKSEL